MTHPAEIDAYPEVARAVANGFGQSDPHDVGIDGRDTNAGATAVLDAGPDDQASALRRLVAAQRARTDDAGLVSGSVPRPPSAPVVAIASGKGGVGKSTIALNLAAASTRACTLIDLDLGTANLDLMCGVSPSRRIDAELFRASGPDFSSMVVPTRFGFGLIPGAAGVAGAADLDAIQRRKLIDAVQRLGASGETVVADLGAGIAPSVIETVAASDLGLIVTTPDPAAIADAYAIIKCVVAYRGDPRPLRLGVVVTMVSGRAEARQAHARIDRVCRRFLGGAVPMLGMVRRDARVVQAARRREPLLSGRAGGPAARDLRGLAALVGALAPRQGRASGPSTLSHP